MERALYRAGGAPAHADPTPAPAPLPIARRWPALRFVATAAALVIAIVGLITMSRSIMKPGALEGAKSIAVLPLVEVSGTSGTSGIGEGLHDQLITTLGQIKSLRVVSRTSMLQFKGSQLSSSAIAKDLGVDAALESTLWYVDGGLAGTSRYAREYQFDGRGRERAVMVADVRSAGRRTSGVARGHRSRGREGTRRGDYGVGIEPP